MTEQDSPPPTITAMKIPIIKKGEYDIWSMRMRQYICHTDHNLWDVIVNGDLEEEAAPSGEQSAPPAPFKGSLMLKCVFPCRHINRSVFVVRVQRPINPGPPFPLVPKSTFFNPLINFGGFMDCQHGNPMWVCGVIDGEVFGCTWEVKRGESDKGGVYGDLAGNAEEDKQCFEC
ncbi:hypothetical protein Tco_0299713 [Tanacetum coccineum]